MNDSSAHAAAAAAASAAAFGTSRRPPNVDRYSESPTVDIDHKEMTPPLLQLLLVWAQPLV